MGGDPSGNDRDNDYRSPTLPDYIAGPVAAQPYTVNGKTRTLCSTRRVSKSALWATPFCHL